MTLTAELEDRGYRTVLVRGREGRDEGTMDYLADELGVRPVLIGAMRRDPGWRDIPALLALARIIRRARPQIVHTHAAKAGTLGRAAALIAALFPGSRPRLVHTYHGHSLTGYFSARLSKLYLGIERVLARHTDLLIAVSDEVRDDLVGLGVAPPSKFVVIPLGLDLARFELDANSKRAAGAAIRAELNISSDARVVTLVARLVPIKRVDRFLRLATELSDIHDVQFLIVGDGELRRELQQSSEARALHNRVTWTGFRRDMPAILAASDVVVQTSDNEGTPVSLIEAQAVGVPVVSTSVGGAPAVVGDRRFLASPGEESELAGIVRTLLGDRELAAAAGAEGRERVLRRFGLARLVADIDRVYQDQLLRPGRRFDG